MSSGYNSSGSQGFHRFPRHTPAQGKEVCFLALLASSCRWDIPTVLLSLWVISWSGWVTAAAGTDRHKKSRGVGEMDV